MNYIINAAQISQISLSRTSSAPADDQAMVRSLIMTVLKEAKEQGALPPPSPADARFPDLLIPYLKNGELKISVVYSEDGIMGLYTSDKKTLTVYLDKKNTPPQKLAQELKVVLLHELYHAYQHLGKVPTKSLSEEEGTAHLLSVKYLCRRLGLRAATPENVKKLLKGANNRYLFFGLDNKALLELIRGALTKDRAEWAAAGNKFGKIFVRAQLFYEFAERYSRLGPAVFQKGFIVYELVPGRKIIIENRELKELDQLNVKRMQAESGQDLPQYHEAIVALLNFWLSICSKHEAIIDAYDRN